MCTLTYLPLPDGFVLTSNRDESPLRPTHFPSIRRIGEREILFPADGVAGGTWVAVADDRRTVCLLNGAFAPHEMGGLYRRSRGLVLLDSFDYASIPAFAQGYDFSGIEPFTLISLEFEVDGLRLLEHRWDGLVLHNRTHAPQLPAIWSSAQLYKPEVIAGREAWFAKWLELHPEDAPEQIHLFHVFGGDGDIYNDVRMNRGFVRTVSTTSIRNEPSRIELRYEDLLSHTSALFLLPGGIQKLENE